MSRKPRDPATMTPADVRLRVEAIAAAHGDYEMAHGDEDRLHQDVLRAIAAGAPDAAELAAEALRTLELDFPRYCA